MKTAEKTKITYVCQQCGASASKWSGQCADCLEWNTLIENKILKKPSRAGYSGQTVGQVKKLSEVNLESTARVDSGIPEFNRVLGGGIVPGSVVMIGGDPGIGKSTLLLQALHNYSKHESALYVTGEESLQQVAMRAQRLGLNALDKLALLSETNIEQILATASSQQYKLLIIDSIQTIYTEELTAAAGAVSQLRESTAKLVQFAKSQQVTIFIVGHVTKEGALAGPRVLEHMVDTVLYFEGQKDSKFRIIRAVKNRFGAVNEIGIFAMTELGLKEVSNPSAIFLSGAAAKAPGSIAMVTWEGSRPMLVELQALVDQSHLGNPRRVCVGVDANRITICLAVLHRHGGISTYDQDVFINIVGGVKVTETAADLAIVMAVLSSLKNRVLQEKLIVFGEIGLAGEVRPVQGGLERLTEAAKHGYEVAIVPKANTKHSDKLGIRVIGVSHISEVNDTFLDYSS